MMEKQRELHWYAQRQPHVSHTRKHRREVVSVRGKSRARLSSIQRPQDRAIH